MLLAEPDRFNTAVRTVLGLAAILLAAPTAADEIRRWRDAQGRLHVEIVGDATSGSPAEPGVAVLGTREPSEEERFSVQASLRRRAIEADLVRESVEVRRLEGEIEALQRKKFVFYAPPTARSAEEAAFLLGRQRTAFLEARRFEEEKRERLRQLRRERRERLLELQGLWAEFERLREDVRSRYRGIPPWWRDRLDCRGCLSAAEVARALAPRAAEPAAEPTTPAEDSSGGTQP
jgi:hypothetical protein